MVLDEEEVAVSLAEFLAAVILPASDVEAAAATVVVALFCVALSVILGAATATVPGFCCKLSCCLLICSFVQLLILIHWPIPVPKILQLLQNLYWLQDSQHTVW